MFRRLALGLLAVITAIGCRPAPVPPADAAIVILISIDGWRWDYLARLRQVEKNPGRLGRWQIEADVAGIADWQPRAN